MNSVYYNTANVFQSTLPREERRMLCMKMKNQLIFQSTLPREERQESLMIRSEDTDISIHAPTRGATTQPERMELPR